MADKPVLKIPVDSQEFDTFLEKFHGYQSLLDGQPEAWRASNKGIKDANAAFSKMDKAFQDMVGAATGSKFADRTSGVFARFEKSSERTRSYWADTSKSLEKSSKYFSDFVRSGISWSALVKGGGLLGAAAGAVGAGAVKAADDLAGKNIANRQLGLKPGQREAFDQVYAGAGGNDELLAKLAAAKSDPSMWHGLQAAGITTQEITTKDPVQLSAELLQKGGSQYNKLGPMGGAWADQTGVSDYLTGNQLRQAGSYSAEQYQQMGTEYQQQVPKQAAAQSVLDQGTEAKKKFDEAWGQIDNAFDQAFIKLSPDITKVVDGIADLAQGFVNSKGFADDVKEVEDTFKELGAGFKELQDDLQPVADALNKLFGLGNNKKKPTDDKDNANDLANGLNQNGLKINKWIHGWADPLMAKYKAEATSINTKFLPADDATPDTGNGNTASNGAGGGDNENNIGNMRPAGASTGFQHFDTMADGAKAMARQLQLYQSKHGLDTASGIVNRWAPASDNNDDAAYIKDVTRRTGFAPDQKLDLSDPKTLAALESAMATHEKGNKYADQLTPDKIAGYLKAAKAQDADTIDGFKTEPFTQSQAWAKTKSDASYVKDQIAAHLPSRRELADIFSEGGGTRFFPDQQQQQARQGSNVQAPYNVHVSVSTPAGSSTTITAGGLAQ